MQCRHRASATSQTPSQHLRLRPPFRSSVCRGRSGQSQGSGLLTQVSSATCVPPGITPAWFLCIPMDFESHISYLQCSHLQRTHWPQISALIINSVSQRKPHARGSPPRATPRQKHPGPQARPKNTPWPLLGRAVGARKLSQMGSGASPGLLKGSAGSPAGRAWGQTGFQV